MHVGLQLPFRFEPERLKSDLALIRPDEWTPHYNQNDYGGDWRGTALRSCDGRITSLAAPHAPASSFLDTPLMSRCSYFREAVDAFACPLRAVRLLSLAPGSFIREHTDNALVYEDGEMRVHIPVQTAPEVEFYVAGERLLFEEGHSYYVNVNLPHRITNRSSTARIHLIIDLEVNDWVHALVHNARAHESAIPRTAPPPRNFDDFASLVFAEPPLREKLRSISNRAEFIDSAVSLARERGFDLLEADVDAALHIHATHGAPIQRTPRFEFAPDKLGWTPIQLRFHNQQPLLEWIYTATRRFTEPFFQDTICECLRHPFTVAFRQESRLDRFDETKLALPASAPHALAPSGFIFHMSRSGSTLVSQMLASLPHTIVISEPPLLDEVLQSHLSISGLSFDQQVEWVRRIVTALGQRRAGAETHYFLKLDSWHIHRLPLLRAAFPQTPCAFLFRDPLEVMRSHAVGPGRQALPGAMQDPRALGLTLEDITRLSRDEWCAHVLARICESALKHRDDRQTLFVEYSALPAAVFGPIARHFSLPLEDADLAQMRERTRFHAKTRSPWPEPDAPLDTQRLQMLRELSADLLAPLYSQLRSASTAAETL